MLDARDDPRSGSREALVRIASAIREDWLFEMFPQSISRERTTQFDEKRGRVVGRGVVRYRDLILSEENDAPVDATGETASCNGGGSAPKRPNYSQKTNEPRIFWRV